MTLVNLGQLTESSKKLLESPISKGHVAVLGDMAMDHYVFGSVDRISPEAPVPVLHASKEENRLGCAANVVGNIAKLVDGLEFKTGAFGVCGEDAAAQVLIDRLKAQYSLDDLCIFQDPSRPTIQKTRFIAGSHHQLLRCDHESLTPVSSELKQRLLKFLKNSSTKYSVLLIEDYAKGLIDEQMMASLLDWARSNQVYTIVDPNKNTPAHTYKGADLITPNVLEAETLVGRSLQKGASAEEAESAAKEIQDKLQIKNVLLKRSAYGMTLLTEDSKVHHFPTQAKEVFDVTGAGDTVVSVLATCRAWGADLLTSVFLANQAAGIVVGKVGSASVTRDELLNSLKSPL